MLGVHGYELDYNGAKAFGGVDQVPLLLRQFFVQRLGVFPGECLFLGARLQAGRAARNAPLQPCSQVRGGTPGRSRRRRKGTGYCYPMGKGGAALSTGRKKMF